LLRRWLLENFKPIHETLNLPLANITVLAGLNSSGKSSLLQSILLISQTLANQSLEKPLILNGSIVKLGTFESVRNDQARKPEIVIGFELSLIKDRHRLGERTGKRISRLGNMYVEIDDPIDSIATTLTFVGTTQEADSTSGIEGVRVVLADALIDIVSDVVATEENWLGPGYPEEISLPSKVSVSVHRLSEQQKISLLNNVSDRFLQVVPYYSEGDNYSVDFSENGVPVPHEKAILARLAHFLPNRFVREFSLEERRRDQINHAIRRLMSDHVPLNGRLRAGLPDVIERVSQHKVSPILLEQVNDMATRNDIGVFSGGTVVDLLEWTHRVQLKTRTKSTFIKRVRNSIQEVLMSELYEEQAENGSTGLEIWAGAYETELIDAATQELTSYFNTMIRYLGPLRADPQAAQGFAPSSEPDDVGSKGEYAAAVYDANRRQRILWWHPTDRVRMETTLEEAIDTWVRHIGVAHHVLTREAGLPGVTWMVQPTEGSRDRPLPAVGVGVSQVLPVLVAGLLAPSGALLLIEQPELHLHAHAQARLGDFFYGLSLVGKQCIIETHSDCLVNQFRYHMVKTGAEARDAIAIYFVEQENGSARFNPVRISENGNIINWPEGFFDESLHQENLITKEAVLARAHQLQNA